jgi:hypothetical protein
VHPAHSVQEVRISKALTDNLNRERSASLRQIVDDPLVRSGAWLKEPIIHTSAGIYSIEAIREMARTEPVEIDRDPRINDGFYEYLASALIATELDSRVESAFRPADRWLDRSEARLLVVSERRPNVPDGILDFSPGKFVAYFNADDLIRYASLPLNLSNRLVRWFVDHAAELRQRLPALHSTLVELLDGPMLSRAARFDGRDIASEINDLLFRVGQLAPDLAPPSDLFL